MNPTRILLLAILPMVVSLTPILNMTGVASAQFVDVTAGPLGNASNGQGVAWGDYDNDGDLDLYLVNNAAANKLFRNDGGGTFVDVTSGPLGDAGFGVAAAWGDYDNDGDLDLYLSNDHQANRLFRNDGGGTFADATSGPLGDTGYGRGVAWADYDNDGDLDLYLANEFGANKLFRNEGDGTFVDATSGPLGDTGDGEGVAWGDYDSDGDLDLYLANNGANKLFRNDGGGTFADATSGPLGGTGHSWCVAWGDYDNDGDLDLYVGNYSGQANKLFRNDGGTFVDATSGPLGDTGWGIGVAWGDYDNDGDLDLYLSNSGSANKLFRNDGGGTFVDATSGPLGDTGAGRGVAWGDYDNDGDLDLYLANWGSANKLFRNEAAAGQHWLQVKLQGTVSNRAGIGARVRVVAGGVSRIREISGGSGYMSQDAMVASFGLGATATVDSLIVRWPGGAVQVVSPALAVDRAIVVVEATVLKFNDIGAGLPPLSSSATWGDYDNDGDLDLFLGGDLWDGEAKPFARVYRNDAGTFTDIGAGLPEASSASAEWGDYDNDGDLDLLLTGYSDIESPDPGLCWIARVYRNDAGVFTDIAAGLPGGANASAAWGDYDNDGDLDLFLSAYSALDGPIARVYRNHAGTFAEGGAGLPPVEGSGTWGDYDNDGDLDLLLTGDTYSEWISRIYRNDTGTFADIGAGLPGAIAGSVAWGDYDNDGDLDLLLTGAVGSYTSFERISRVFRNDTGTFADIGAGLPGVTQGSVAWGDYDNDGDLDLLLTGYTGSEGISRVFRNDAGTFTHVGAGLPESNGSAAWGDYDNDGDLDLVLTGYTGSELISGIYRNDGAPANTPPTVPDGLSASVVGDQATLNWNAATDAQTPVMGLSYNLRVGTTPGGSDICSGMADGASGHRGVVQMGNAQQNAWTMQLPTGTYFWSVQAVDGAYAGSPFAAEGSFSTVATDVLDVTLGDSEFPFHCDQRSERWSDRAAILAGTPLGQEFVPRWAAPVYMMNIVELRTEDWDGPGGVGATLQVRIRAGTMGGTILGSSEPLVLPDGFGGICHFTFADTIGLTPGSPYVLEVLHLSGDAWGISYTTVDRYAGGSMIVSGAPVPGDLWFREGLTSASDITLGICDLLGIYRPSIGSTVFHTDISYGPNPLAVSRGPFEGSVLLTTGRAADGGLGNTAWGGGGEETLELRLSCPPPPGMASVHFTTQFITTEFAAGRPGNDAADLGFGIREDGEEVYVDINLGNIISLTTGAVNAPVSHAIEIGNAYLLNIHITIREWNDGYHDSALLLSDFHFSPDTVAGELIPGTPYRYLQSPAPHDMGVLAGTYTYAKEICTVGGASPVLPFDLSLHYSSESVRNPAMGCKWTHSYDVFAQKLHTDDIVVHHGNGGVEYFEPDVVNGGYRPKFPGTHGTLVANPDGTVRLTTPEQVRYEFTASSTDGTVHRLGTVADANGKQVTLAYSSDRLAQVTDTRGGQAVFSYDAGGWLERVTYGKGADVREILFCTHDTTGNLLSLRDANGYTTAFTYDDQANLLTGTDGDGLRFVKNLYFAGRLAYQEDAAGNSASLTFENGDLSSQRPDGTVRYEYDNLGRMTKRTDPGGGVSAFAYDEDNNPTCVIDPLGAATHRDYDASGNLTYERDALGHVTQVSYDTRNNPVLRVDPLQKEWHLAYDGADNLVSQTDPLNHSEHYLYDGYRRKIIAINANGDSTRFGYSAAGDLTWTRDPLGHFTEYCYDSLGRSMGTRTGGGPWSSVERDPGGRVTRLIDALGHATVLAYDAQDRVVQTTGPDGAVMTTTYTPTGKVATITDGLGRVTAYGYDGAARVVAITDPVGNRTTFGYDAGGRMNLVTDALGHSASATYDAAGNRTSLTDPNGNTTTFAYDSLGQVVLMTDPLGRTSTTTYDARGAVASVTAGGLTTSYAYDDAGRLTGLTTPDGTITHALDAVGNPLSSSSDGRWSAVTRTFDALGRLTSRTDARGYTVGYEYDARGNVSALVYPGNWRVTYEYDALDQLVQVCYPSGAGYPWETGTRCATYTYDVAGNLVAAVLPDSSRTSFTYDLNHALTGYAEVDGDSTAIQNASFTIDERGLQTAASLTLPLEPPTDVEPATYRYDRAGQLVARGEEAFAYDASGNLVTAVLDGIPRSLGFNALNQLETVDADQYAYDTDGLRVRTTRSGVTTWHVYDLSSGRPRLLEERDDAGHLVARYVHGLGLVCRQDSTRDVRFYHYDRLGSTVALTDTTGAITDRYAYDPYGRLVAHEGTTPNPFRFVGRDGVVDDGNGLYLMGARYYAPELMRFVQPDRVVAGDLTQPQTLNTYAYVEGNPVSLTDPEGTCPMCVSVAVSIAVDVALLYATDDDVTAKDLLITIGIATVAGLIPAGPAAGVFAKGVGKAKAVKSAWKAAKATRLTLLEGKLVGWRVLRGQYAKAVVTTFGIGVVDRFIIKQALGFGVEQYGDDVADFASDKWDDLAQSDVGQGAQATAAVVGDLAKQAASAVKNTASDTWNSGKKKTKKWIKKLF